VLGLVVQREGTRMLGGGTACNPLAAWAFAWSALAARAFCPIEAGSSLSKSCLQHVRGCATGARLPRACGDPAQGQRFGRARVVDFLADVAPVLDSSSHKGQGGRIGVIGGSEEFTGAPYYAGLAALRTGAELVYVLTAEEAALPLKAYSPELMVTPVYSGLGDADHIMAAFSEMMPRFHALVVGPGLGRKRNVLKGIARIISLARSGSIPVVIDADALQAIVEDPSVVAGHQQAVLTPNAAEYRRLVTAVMREDASTELDQALQLQALSRALGGVTICLKGRSDLVGDAADASACVEPGSPRRCGGLGDILAGSLAALLAWLGGRRARRPGAWCARDAALAACVLVRRSCRAAFLRHRRATTAPDVLAELGGTFEELCPADGSVAAPPA